MWSCAAPAGSSGCRFLSDELQRKLTDERGNFELYHQIQPLEVPRLSFCGYNSSFFSPLSAELAALWITVFPGGGIELAPVEQQRAEIQERLRWMEQRTGGHHARGTNVIPFSKHNIDEMLGDIGINVGTGVRLRQWLCRSTRSRTGSCSHRSGGRYAARAAFDSGH